MSSIDDLKRELDAAARIQDSAERAVTVAALVAEALRPTGRDPVLVGGAAVEFYTQGGHSTRDIDFVADGGPDLAKVMADLGFEKYGKDFVDEKRKVYVEFPSASLKPGEEPVLLSIGTHKLRIISIEDLIVDRLCAYKFWRSAIDGLNALLLLESGEIDEARLGRRALAEDVQNALEAVQEVREEAVRKKLSRKEANRLLEEKIRRLQ